VSVSDLEKQLAGTLDLTNSSRELRSYTSRAGCTCLDSARGSPQLCEPQRSFKEALTIKSVHLSVVESRTCRGDRCY
jgi:hypothetical protein